MDLQSPDISKSAPEQQLKEFSHVEELIDTSPASVSAAMLVPAPADEQLVELKHPSSRSTASSVSALVGAVMNEPTSTLRSPQSVAAGRQKPKVPPLPLPKHRRIAIKLTFTSAPHVPRARAPYRASYSHSPERLHQIQAENARTVTHLMAISRRKVPWINKLAAKGTRINNTKKINQQKQAEAGLARENFRLRGRLQAIKASPEVSRVLQTKRHVKVAQDSKGLQAKAQVNP